MAYTETFVHVQVSREEIQALVHRWLIETDQVEAADLLLEPGLTGDPDDYWTWRFAR